MELYRKETDKPLMQFVSSESDYACMKCETRRKPTHAAFAT